MTMSFNEIKNSPEQASATLEKLDSAMQKYSSIYFESREITKNENRFYVLPEDWRRYSFSEKKDILDMAASLAVSERKKNDKNGYYSKTQELPRTKIYNVKNNELLGEYFLDENLLYSENTTTKNILKSAMTAYKFYKPTK